MKKSKPNGKSIILSPEKIKIGEFKYVDGEMTGDCKLYYGCGALYFTGYLYNGYRQGRGVEYEKNGRIICEGLFVGGLKDNHYTLDQEMSGYWKETDEQGNQMSLCKIDKYLNKQGVCYFFKHGKIHRISKWKDNLEVEIIKRFKNDKMIEYEDGVRTFKGSYYQIDHFNYIRVSGLEYDITGKRVVYDGDFIDNKRSGFGTLYNSQGDIIFDGVWRKGIKLTKYLGFFFIPYAIIVLLICVMTWLYSYDYKSVIGVLVCGIVFGLYKGVMLSRIDVIPVPIDIESDNALPIYYNSNREVFFPIVEMNSFKNFRIVGLRKMKQLQISEMYLKNSLTSASNEFSIENCIELESIKIGCYAFFNYNKFKLHNLPSLKTIVIGKIEKQSNNFYSSCFELKST